MFWLLLNYRTSGSVLFSAYLFMLSILKYGVCSKAFGKMDNFLHWTIFYIGQFFTLSDYELTLTMFVKFLQIW